MGKNLSRTVLVASMTVVGLYFQNCSTKTSSSPGNAISASTNSQATLDDTAPLVISNSPPTLGQPTSAVPGSVTGGLVVTAAPSTVSVGMVSQLSVSGGVAPYHYFISQGQGTVSSDGKVVGSVVGSVQVLVSDSANLSGTYVIIIMPTGGTGSSGIIMPTVVNLTAADCNNGRCKGGYGGKAALISDPSIQSTLDHVCVSKGKTKGMDFTVNLNSQPGGKFCTYSGVTWGCDSSCDGCNPITSVVCN